MRSFVLAMFALLMLCGTSYVVFADPVQYVPPYRYTITVDNHSLSLPMIFNGDPSEPHPEATRAVLYTSNGTREVVPIGQTLVDARDLADVDSASVLMVGLQYLYEVDIEEHDLDDDVAFWKHEHWFIGNLSDSTDTHPRPVKISAYAWMDTLLAQVVSLNPQIETISFLGESAGGKFFQRYAATTRLPYEMDLPELIFVTVNNGSFLYFDEYRFDLDDEWSIPGPINQSFVPKYNQWPYGLEELNEYTTETGAQVIFDNFPSRNMFHFIGEEDNGLNSDDKPMNMQGMNNIMRHVFYWDHLHHLWGNGIEATQQVVIMEDYGHEGHAIVRSPACRNALFLYDPSTSVDETGNANGALPASVELTSYPNPFNPSATVKLYLPSPGEVRVSVFNLLGESVATLAHEEMAAGTHTFTFDGSEMSSGVYFVQVVAPGQIYKTKKITLVK
ncbi:T9SS type A sorting domain-containing protein [bacterium]|nr:T9SS type A sorting domain-containing protein [bacterium]